MATHSASPIIGVGACVLSFAVNTAFCVLKITAGVLGNSYGLIADGIESAADILSSLIVWKALRFSQTPPDRNHPYGHGKAESLASFVAALALGGSALLIAWNSVTALTQTHESPRWFTLYVLAGVIIVKTLMWCRLSHYGKTIDSRAIRNDAVHHLADAFSSTAVLIGLLVALIGGPAYAHADNIAALIVCTIILYNAYHILLPSIDELMDADVAPEHRDCVRETASKVEGVCAIEQVRIRKSGLGYLVDIHVEVPGEMDVRRSHAIAHAVKDALLALDTIRIVDVIVHIEPH